MRGLCFCVLALLLLSGCGNSPESRAVSDVNKALDQLDKVVKADQFYERCIRYQQIYGKGLYKAGVDGLKPVCVLCEEDIEEIEPNVYVCKKASLGGRAVPFSGRDMGL